MMSILKNPKPQPAQSDGTSGLEILLILLLFILIAGAIVWFFGRRHIRRWWRTRNRYQQSSSGDFSLSNPSDSGGKNNSLSQIRSTSESSICKPLKKHGKSFASKPRRTKVTNKAIVVPRQCSIDEINTNSGCSSPKKNACSPIKCGPRGPQGKKGCDGPQGKRGHHGCAGPQGFRGHCGVQGPRGPRGCQGVQGPQGPIAVNSGILPYSTEGVVPLQNINGVRILNCLGFGQFSNARVLDPTLPAATQDYSKLFVDIAWVAPRDVLLTSMAISVTSRPNLAPTIPPETGGLFFHLYVNEPLSSPDTFQDTGFGIFLPGSGSTVTLTQVVNFSLLVPQGRSVALVIVNAIDLGATTGTEDFITMTNIDGSVGYQ